MFTIINNYIIINNINLFILKNVRMGAVYFISKSKGAVDPKRLTTIELGHLECFY